MIQAMKPFCTHDKTGESSEGRGSEGNDTGVCLLRSMGWITAGVAAVTLRIVIGR